MSISNAFVTQKDICSFGTLGKFEEKYNKLLYCAQGLHDFEINVI